MGADERGSDIKISSKKEEAKSKCREQSQATYETITTAALTHKSLYTRTAYMLCRETGSCHGEDPPY